METYTITISGSTYIAKNSSGTTVATNISFSSMIISLVSLLADGDKVIITNGNYVVSADVINSTKNGIHWLGNSLSVILQATDTLTDNIFTLGSETPGHGDSQILDTITFDSNMNENISPSEILLSQVGCIVQNCKFLNAWQYGLEAWMAKNFQILNNVFNYAQYCIATGGGVYGGVTYLADGGLIKGNFMQDSTVGVKLRWVQNTIVEHNTIDCAWLTAIGVDDSRPSDGSYTQPGIYFYHGDGPTYNCTAQYNNIYDSKYIDGSAGIQHATGVFIANDTGAGGSSYGLSSGMKVIGNIIVCYYGVIQEYKKAIIQNNKFYDLAGNTCTIDIYMPDGNTDNTINGNLHKSTGTLWPYKVTTSANISGASLTVHGFQLNPNEVFYTELGGTLVVGASPISGYMLDHFVVTGSVSGAVNLIPNSSGLSFITITAQNYTIEAIYKSGITQSLTSPSVESIKSITTTNPPTVIEPIFTKPSIESVNAVASNPIEVYYLLQYSSTPCIDPSITNLGIIQSGASMKIKKGATVTITAPDPG